MDIETQRSITFIRNIFEKNLSFYLNLTRVTAPLFVKSNTGINDNLNGTERPVVFDIPALNCNAEIVHSLAKWKRIALAKYNLNIGEGIYTNMNAIRRDEQLDELHSVYVDQWDWEKVINKERYTVDYLKDIVNLAYEAIKATYYSYCKKSKIQEKYLPDFIKFITSEELLSLYPGKTAKECEYEYMKSSKDNYALFVIGIGYRMNNNEKYDGRSPDYDNWHLNGDLILFDEDYDRQVEISSMGIRVDKDTLVKQLTEEDCLDRLNLDFHKMLMNDELPLSIGGGIGQSRLCMWMMNKKHIKEVQESIW